MTVRIGGERTRSVPVDYPVVARPGHAAEKGH